MRNVKVPKADLLANLAERSGQLVSQLSREPEAYRIAGRLCRLADVEAGDLAEQKAIAFAEAHVYQAKVGVDAFADDPLGYFLLQCALAIISFQIWEDLWNETHPERFGQVWEAVDVALMPVWREKVRTMITECGQQAVFAMTMEDYQAKLFDAGADEETTAELVTWMSVLYEYAEGTGAC